MSNTTTPLVEDKAQLKKGDFVYVTEAAVKESPGLAKLWKGGTIHNIDAGGVAEVHVTEVVRVHVSKLTDPMGPDAYDPIP